MMYLDANFFIFALLDNTRKGEKAREIQQKLIEGKENAVTSALALDEVMWVLRKNKKQHLLRKIIEDIYAHPRLVVREVHEEVPLRALQYIEEFNLKPRDAFHAAVMEGFLITAIVSDDVDFDRIKKIKRIALE